ncbi:hypothetical protein [Nonomuraea sp. 10N515B]|uniref:hypothetical protein n=1 Tax=Nonomuraea sp. 10N515B TaxID=3457422 RepID=UPI003FCC64E4
MRPSRSGSSALVALCLLDGACSAAPPSGTSVTVTVTVEQQRQAMTVPLDSVTLMPGEDLEYIWSHGR